MELQQQFEQAVADSKTLSEKPDNQVLLQLYSLYKQATIGDVHDNAPVNVFDFIAKLKYEAWSKLKGMLKEDAMKAYIHLIARLKK